MSSLEQRSGTSSAQTPVPQMSKNSLLFPQYATEDINVAGASTSLSSSSDPSNNKVPKQHNDSSSSSLHSPGMSSTTKSNPLLLPLDSNVLAANRQTTIAMDIDDNSKTLNNAETAQLSRTLAPFLDKSGGLASASHINSYIAAVHKLKDERLKVHALSHLLAIRNQSTLDGLLTSKLPDLLRLWLTAAIKEGSEEQKAVIVSILKLLITLPMTVNVLRASSLGKFVNRLKKHSSTDVSTLSNTLYDNWKSLLSDATAAGDESLISPTTTTSNAEVLKTKRPAEQQQTQQSTKKAIDYDIFDMFKQTPAAAMPKIKKQKVESAKKSLQPMNKMDSVESLASSSLTSSSVSTLNTAAVAVGVKKKRVTWAPDSLLCQIKVFHSEPAHSSSKQKYRNAKEMERNEMGAVLEMLRSEMRPVVEWSEPIHIRLPSDVEIVPVQSNESAVQAERERVTLAEVYLDPLSIPKSPAEASMEEQLAASKAANSQVPQIPLWPNGGSAPQQVTQVMQVPQQQVQQPQMQQYSQYYPVGPQQQQPQMHPMQYMQQPQHMQQMPQVYPQQMQPNPMAQMMHQAHPMQQMPQQMQMFYGAQMNFYQQQQLQQIQVQQQMQQQMQMQQHLQQQEHLLQQQPQQQSNKGAGWPQPKAAQKCKFGDKCKRKSTCKFQH